MELHQAASKALADLGASGVMPPYAGISLALVNPITGKVGASVDRDGSLTNAVGEAFLTLPAFTTDNTAGRLTTWSGKWAGPL